MKEKHKIYIFSVLSHGAVGATSYSIIYLLELIWPRSNPRVLGLLEHFLIWCGVGIVMFPFFINLYEPTYRYLFKAGKDKER